MRYAILLCLLVLAIPAQADTYSVERAVIGANGGTVTGGPFTLQFTVGQAASGTASGTDTRLNSGFWWEVTTSASVGVVHDALPTAFAFKPNVPNPFLTSTIVRYAIPAGVDVLVTIGIYDLRGALVKTLAHQTQSPGNYTLTWNGTSDDGGRLAAGVYFVRFQTPSFTRYHRVVMLK